MLHSATVRLYLEVSYRVQLLICLLHNLSSRMVFDNAIHSYGQFPLQMGGCSETSLYERRRLDREFLPSHSRFPFAIDFPSLPVLVFQGRDINAGWWSRQTMVSGFESRKCLADIIYYRSYLEGVKRGYFTRDPSKLNDTHVCDSYIQWCFARLFILAVSMFRR